MNQYTAEDFINADITVTQLVGVEHTDSPIWARDTAFPRVYDGIMIFISGSIEYYYGEHTFTATPGTVLKLPKGVPYSGKRLTSDNVEIYLCDFTALGDGLLDFPIPFVMTPTDGEAVLNKFKEILDIWKRQTLLSRLEAKNALSELLLMLSADIAVNKCGYDSKNRIIKMCRYIKDNCASPELRISDVAKHFHISEAHLRRIFTGELNTSPVEYLMTARINKARERLKRYGDESIGSVAEKCGFSSVYYFSNAFREAVGCSPSDYRAGRIEISDMPKKMS